MLPRIPKVLTFMDNFGWSLSIKRNYLRTTLAPIFKAFPTGSAALSWFRESGGTIRTQDFYDVRRQVLGLTKYEENIKNLAGDHIIPRTWINQEHGLELKGKEIYYRQQVKGIDPRTGEEKEMWITILDDKQRSKEWVQEEAGNYIAGDPEWYQIEVEEFGRMIPIAPEGYFER